MTDRQTENRKQAEGHSRLEKAPHPKNPTTMEALQSNQNFRERINNKNSDKISYN